MYVLMLVPSNFPDGDAGAVRDMAFANIFMELGYDVFLIGAGKCNKEGIVNGIKYYSVYREAKTKLDHLKRFLFSKSTYMSFIKQIIIKNGFPSIIYINDVAHRLIKHLRKCAKKNNILMIHDSTEWYSACEFKYGVMDKQYILKNNLNRAVIKNPIKVIGISSYMTDYFKNRGINAVRIPVIMNVLNSKIAINNDSKIKLIYAGSPANKDYLKEIILGTTMLSEDNKQKIELHIVGVNELKIKEMTKLKSLPTCIKTYGWIPREMVEKVMLKMDFSVLLRPAKERYAKAGFPTKSVEAMSHGVSMLCNISSDLGMYLKDGENAIIISGCDEKSFLQGLERVLMLNRNQINSIKKNARQLAEREFDYRNWINTVSDFIGDK